MWEDRKKKELKEAAITVPRCKNPIKRLRPRPLLQLPPVIPCFLREFNRENLQLRSSGSSSFNLPSSLRGSCNIVVRFLVWHRGTVIAASFGSCFFLSSHIPSHPFFLDIIQKTYKLEPPISIYLKNTSLYLHALSVLS
jgi:hypothetical protein